jgi:TRAP-type uncharacterized transport system substrate-binding protein
MVKEAMLGFVTAGVALQGWNGTDWAKGTRYRSILVIFPMYDTAFQFAALKALRSSRSTISPDCESAFVHGRVQGVPMSLRFSKSLASPPTLLRRIEQMASPAVKETVPANIGRDTVLPLRPGAERYYREIGIPIPVEQTH